MFRDVMSLLEKFGRCHAKIRSLDAATKKHSDSLGTLQITFHFLAYFRRQVCCGFGLTQTTRTRQYGHVRCSCLILISAKTAFVALIKLDLVYSQ